MGRHSSFGRAFAEAGIDLRCGTPPARFVDDRTVEPEDGSVLRASLGITMIAHGWNHAFGGGKLPGTARWFESIGIRPGRLHALLGTLTELGAGACCSCRPSSGGRPPRPKRPDTVIPFSGCARSGGASRRRRRLLRGRPR
ncbi:DoxX family protein [Actinocorallia aurantiaca]